MKLRRTWLTLALACGWPGVLCAQLQLLPDPEPQRVFAGEARKISVVWHKTGDKAASAEVHARLYQTSSATAVLLTETLWKKIEILPGQTVLESTSMDFPAVNAETRFLIQWLEGTNRVIGKTEVLVYPTNLLGELMPLLGGAILGVLDPNNELKPLLRAAKVDFVDVGETVLENFQGKLAIIGPFLTKSQMREGLATQIQALAKKNTAIVWLQPPRAGGEKLQPSFYSVPETTNAVVVVQPELVSDLSDNPQSQLNLVYFCKLAMQPETFRLPGSITQP